MGADLSRVDEEHQLALEGVTTTPTSLTLPEDATLDRCAEIGSLLVKIDGATKWWIGDWWDQTVDKHGEASWQILGERAGARVDAVDLSLGRVMNLQNVVRSVPPSRRRERLTFYHHDLVAKLSPAEQDAWLDRCEEADPPWSARELRRQLRVAGLKPADLEQPQWSGTPEQQLEQAERERKSLLADRRALEEELQELKLAAGILIRCPMCSEPQLRAAAEAAALVVDPDEEE